VSAAALPRAPVPRTEPVDIVMWANAPVAQLARTLHLLEQRTSERAGGWLIGVPEGPTTEELQALIVGRDGWTVLHTGEMARDGSPLDLPAALLAGGASFVAVVDGTARLPWGWQSGLLAAAAAPDVGAVAAIGPHGGDGTRLEPPRHAERLGADGTALLLAGLFAGVAWPLDQQVVTACLLLRRAALNDVGVSGGAASGTGAVAEQLLRSRWGVVATPAVYVESAIVHGSVTARGRRRRRAHDDRLGDARGALADAVSARRALGGMLRRGGPVMRVAFVLEHGRTDAETVRALTYVAGLRDLGLPVDVLHLGDREPDESGGARVVPPDALAASLRGAAVVVAGHADLANAVADAAGRQARQAVVLTTAPAAPGVGAVREIEVPHVIDEDRFRLGSDAGDHADRLAVRVIGARVDDALERFHTGVTVSQVTADLGTPELLADQLAGSDLLLVLGPDMPGRAEVVLAGMACGAVPVLRTDARVPFVEHDRDALVSGVDDAEVLATAVALSANWTRLAALRQGAHQTVVRHRRAPVAATVYAALLTLREPS
jgi:hypothetical protein